MDIILAFVVGGIVGGFLVTKFLPGYLKSTFSETASDALAKVTQEAHGDQDQYEKEITIALDKLRIYRK